MGYLSALRLQVLLPVTLLLGLLPSALQAQSSAAARRSESVDLYATGAVSQTDYNSTDKGFVLGADFTYHLHLFDASLDLRYNHVTGDSVGEKSFDGGVKIAKAFGRYHPYAQLLIGYGVITFNHPLVNPDGSLYQSDNSTIYDFGGGLDVDLTRAFSLKLDAQDQSWNLGKRGDASSVSFNPTLFSVGVVYHLPYRFLRPRRY